MTTASLDGLYTKLRKSGGRKGAPLSPSSVRRIHVAVRGVADASEALELDRAQPRS